MSFLENKTADDFRNATPLLTSNKAFRSQKQSAKGSISHVPSSKGLHTKNLSDLEQHPPKDNPYLGVRDLQGSASKRMKTISKPTAFNPYSETSATLTPQTSDSISLRKKKVTFDVV